MDAGSGNTSCVYLIQLIKNKDTLHYSYKK